MPPARHGLSARPDALSGAPHREPDAAAWPPACSVAPPPAPVHRGPRRSRSRCDPQPQGRSPAARRPVAGLTGHPAASPRTAWLPLRRPLGHRPAPHHLPATAAPKTLCPSGSSPRHPPPPRSLQRPPALPAPATHGPTSCGSGHRTPPHIVATSPQTRQSGRKPFANPKAISTLTPCNPTPL